MSKIAFTIVAKNYFASALTLAHSIKQSNPDCTFYIVLADKIDEKISEIKDDSYILIEAEKFKIDRFYEMAYKYDVTEFATSIKPFCIEYFQNIRGVEAILYIDPDIYVYEPFDEVFELLKQYSAVVTPHILTMNNVSQDIELGLLHSGIYNLGFFGIANTEDARKIVGWWKGKLLDYAYSDIATGLYTDQKWMNLVTIENANIYVLRDYAYNVAWWNFEERNIYEVSGKPYVRQGETKKKVVFFHFSGFKVGKDDTISKSESFKLLQNKKEIIQIFNVYQEKLKDNRYEEFSKLPYAYLTYDNGIVITMLQRRLYRSIIQDDKVRTKYSCPFNTNSDSYYSLLKKNGLIVKSFDASKAFTKRENVPEISRKEKIIKTLLMISEKILGVQKYEILIRYLSHELRAENQIFLLRSESEDDNC